MCEKLEITLTNERKLWYLIIFPQLIAGLEFLHLHKFRYHGINSNNVLIWNLDPIAVKLSDSGITHPPSNCNVGTILVLFHNKYLSPYQYSIPHSLFFSSAPTLIPRWVTLCVAPPLRESTTSF